MLGGGLGTITSGLRLGWNIAANTIGSGVIGAGIAGVNNMLYGCDDHQQYQDAGDAALKSGLYGGLGTAGGQLLTATVRSAQGALKNLAWQRASAADRNIGGSNAISGPYYPKSHTPAGVALGSALFNVIANISNAHE